MKGSLRTIFATLALAVPAGASEGPATATIETTLRTANRQIRQFALDGDPATAFVSAQDAGPSDRFTIAFDRPLDVTAIGLETGRPDQSDGLDAGALEYSTDGQSFNPIARIGPGRVHVAPRLRGVRAIRIRPTEELKHPLAIAEVTVASDPPLSPFRYPIEIVTDVSDAPELKDWAEKAARACERAYPLINETLGAEGYRPPSYVTMTFRGDYRGVAAAGGGRITGSVRYFKDHPDDVGALIHETAHIAQRYRSRNNPGWLVEGVADYVRFFKYEPGKIGRINPDRARYDRSYRVTAAFLAYAADRYDKDLVRKLNKAMRAGTYREAMFQEFTGKTVRELDEEWRASLRK